MLKRNWVVFRKTVQDPSGFGWLVERLETKNKAYSSKVCKKRPYYALSTKTSIRPAWKYQKVSDAGTFPSWSVSCCCWIPAKPERLPFLRSRVGDFTKPTCSSEANSIVLISKMVVVIVDSKVVASNSSTLRREELCTAMRWTKELTTMNLVNSDSPVASKEIAYYWH